MSVAKLQHYVQDYNPVYAHEYYLRTRHLKGRAPKLAAPPKVKTSTTAPSKSSSSSVSIKLSNGKTLSINKSQLGSAEAHVTQRISQLQKQLSDLHTKLAKAQAKTNTTAKGKKPLTAAQKAHASQLAKQNRAKSRANKAVTKGKATPGKAAAKTKPTSTTSSVVSIKNQIAKIQGALAVAQSMKQAISAATKSG